ncbi:ATP-binding protein [Photobacterium toruni]|uniref:ATP-binding protein n=1 Tax=Photobacterium toruni TaxID=1935446 RepID=A0ABU6LB96_9GAMM|nr:ATP-binding protein [Photobacterium toruni]
MKKTISKNIIKKRTYRSKCSKLKRKLSNCCFLNWIVRENIKKKLKLIKYPKHNITRKKNYSPSKRIVINAPESLDYYNNSNFNKTNRFIYQLRDCVKNHKRKVLINFSDTNKISAAAMLSLLSEIDILIQESQYGKHSISFNHPKNDKVLSILKQIGLYELLGKTPKIDTKKYDDVSFWRYCSGHCSTPLIVKSMFVEIQKEVAISASKQLYRGFIEAMSNSVEHAYMNDDNCISKNNTSKWWTFAGVRDNKLCVVVCDKGLGIPSTLPKTQGMDRIKDILISLGANRNLVSDSNFIKAATCLSKTRTGKDHRGKGLADIKSVIDTIGHGHLLIFSNKGEYRYKAHGKVNEVIRDKKTSINGTIIEWIIPLQECSKENDVQ